MREYDLAFLQLMDELSQVSDEQSLFAPCDLDQTQRTAQVLLEFTTANKTAFSLPDVCAPVGVRSAEIRIWRGEV
jgi:hypothetical protein